MNPLSSGLLKPETLKKTSFILFVMTAVVIAVQHYYKPSFNNFKVFVSAFQHLLDLKNLHDYYPAEHDDQFLYAPPAAVWLGIFSIFKTGFSIILWNVFTTLSWWLAIYHLPNIDLQVKNKIAFFAFIELTTSLHNLQTNPLLTAMIVASFILLEKNQLWKSHFITALAFFTKGISGAGVFLLLFYNSYLKNAFSFFIAFIAVAMLPALFVGFNALPGLYMDWIQVLLDDHEVNSGISVIGLIHDNISKGINAYVIQVVGLLLFLIDLMYIRMNKKNTFGWRFFALSFILIWVILFNHAAESSGYIFGVTGVALWLFNKTQDKVDRVLFFMVLFFTILAPTDLYPKVFRVFLYDHSIKALPILLVWIKMHFDLFKSSSPFELKYLG